jgi:diguanylate cyclase (GGDEF)-like protein
MAVDRALEKSHEVKAKVEACAEELAATNESVKQEIAAGVTELSATQTLADSEVVEAKVQECADDLEVVTETLARGIADIKQVENELAQSQSDLLDTQIALVQAQADEQEATLRALHDAATGLPNRVLFNDRLEHAIALADRHSWTLAVMFMDLDGFKSVNDDHGHAAGDTVLLEVARRLSQHARDEDTVCRNGGDEFLYLMMNPNGRTNVEHKATAVLNDIAQPIDASGQPIIIRASIGIALFPENETTVEGLVRMADAAMYRAKSAAGGFAFA